MEIIIFVIGALFGMVLTLAVQIFTRDKSQPAEHETPEKPDERQMRIQEQWDNFFSYNGTDQNGGV